MNRRNFLRGCTAFAGAAVVAKVPLPPVIEGRIGTVENIRFVTSPDLGPLSDHMADAMRYGFSAIMRHAHLQRQKSIMMRHMLDTRAFYQGRQWVKPGRTVFYRDPSPPMIVWEDELADIPEQVWVGLDLAAPGPGVSIWQGPEHEG